jgi:hypothetical protein
VSQLQFRALVAIALSLLAGFALAEERTKDDFDVIYNLESVGNVLLLRAETVKFEPVEQKSADGKPADGIFFAPFLNGRPASGGENNGIMSSPHRAVGTIIVEIPENGRFDCPDDLYQKIKGAAKLRVFRLKPAKEE